MPVPSSCSSLWSNVILLVWNTDFSYLLTLNTYVNQKLMSPQLSAKILIMLLFWLVAVVKIILPRLWYICGPKWTLAHPFLQVSRYCSNSGMHIWRDKEGVFWWPKTICFGNRFQGNGLLWGLYVSYSGGR